MAIKNEWELKNIARACDIAEEGFLKLLPEIKEGMTESEVAALLEYNMRTLGAYSTSFDTIVAFGAHAAVPHHVTGDTKLRFGDEILIDFGCKVDGYCSDITRTFLFGDDGKHADFKKAYAAVLAAHELVKENLKAGMTGGDGGRDRAELSRIEGLRKVFHPFPRSRNRPEYPRISLREKGRAGRARKRNGILGRAGRLSRGRIRNPHRGYDYLEGRKRRKFHAQGGQKSRDPVRKAGQR